MVDPRLSEQLVGPVLGEDLGQLAPHRQRGIQRLPGSWKTIEMWTADPPHPPVGDAKQVEGLHPEPSRPQPAPEHSRQGAVAGAIARLASGSGAPWAGGLRAEQGVPRDDPRRDRNEPDQRPGGHRLARAGLADQAEVSPSWISRLTPSTACTTPRFVPKWIEGPAARRAGACPARFAGRCRAHPRPESSALRTRIEHVAESVPHQVERQRPQEHHQAAEHGHPPRRGDDPLVPHSRGCPIRRVPPRRAR